LILIAPSVLSGPFHPGKGVYSTKLANFTNKTVFGVYISTCGASGDGPGQEEYLDLLLALNARLPGMATVHATSAREALVKLCTLTTTATPEEPRP
jgi:hypothetical protein